MSPGVQLPSRSAGNHLSWGAEQGPESPPPGQSSGVLASMATVTTPLRIGLADHGRAMTLDEFEEAGFEEGYRYELARGVLEVSEDARGAPRGDRMGDPSG